MTSPIYDSSTLEEIIDFSPNWKYHHQTQHFVWEREIDEYLVLPVEIDNYTVTSTSKTYSTIVYDAREEDDPYFYFKPKQPLNIIIKLKSTDVRYPRPVDTVKFISFQILYRGQVPPESYYGDPNFVFVSNFEVQKSDEIIMKDVRFVSHMTDLRKKIFAGTGFDMKEKPKFNLIVKVWSGNNCSCIDIPFRMNSTKTPLDGIEGERDVTLTGSVNFLNADDTPLREAISFNMQLLKNTKKRASIIPQKLQVVPEKKKSMSTPLQRPSHPNFTAPHSINFSNLRVVIECETTNPMQPHPTQIIVTSEGGSKFKIQTDTGIMLSLDAFHPLPDDSWPKFTFCDTAQVVGITPTSLPTNALPSPVTIIGQFPFHNVMSGKFDVLFGEESCLSIQKINATQIVVVPPAHLPATVEVRVFYTDVKGERVQIPAENDINPTFVFTDEDVPPNTNQNIYFSPDLLGLSRLHRVCAAGDIHTVIACLNQKESPYQRDNYGWTSFHRACAAGRLGVSKLLFLVTLGQILEYPDYRGLSALSLPALEGDVNFVTEFWNWIREVRLSSLMSPLPSISSTIDAEPSFRPVLPPPQIPSSITLDNEYRRSYVAACAVAEQYLPKADINHFRIMTYDESHLHFNILRGTTVLYYNRAMKLLCPHRNVKGVLLCINHPHFSRKESRPVYYGYSADLRTIQTVSHEIGIIERDPIDGSIILPPLDDIEIPPYEQLYSAYGKPVVYFSLFVDVFIEDSMDKMSVLRFDIPVLYEVNLPEEEIGTHFRVLKEGSIQESAELQNPSVLITSASSFHQVVQPFHDIVQFSRRSHHGE